MATASVTFTFTNGLAADASEVNTNFAEIISFLNNSVIHKDGSVALANNQVTTASITNGAVTTDKVADNAITTTKIGLAAVNAPRILDTAVTSAKIADGAVTDAKLANAAGGQVNSIRYRKLGTLVFVWGSTALNGVGDTIPAGYRPVAAASTVGLPIGSSTPQLITVNTNGVVTNNTSGSQSHFSIAYTTV